MNTREKLIILFHLQRSNGNTLFLHSFNDPNLLMEIDEQTVIEGRYGHEPDMEQIGRLRRELHGFIDDGVLSWIREYRFPYRFIWTIGFFLGSYGLIALLSSGLLPIDFPVVDGLLLSLALSGCFYYFFRQRDLSSSQARARREYLKERVDTCVFYPDSFITEVEELLYRYESGNYEALLQVLKGPHEKGRTGARPEMAGSAMKTGIGTAETGAEIGRPETGAEGSISSSQTGELLLEYLKKRYSRRSYRREEKFFRRLLQSGASAGCDGSQVSGKGVFAAYLAKLREMPVLRKFSRGGALESAAKRISSGDSEFALFLTYCHLKQLINVRS